MTVDNPRLRRAIDKAEINLTLLFVLFAPLRYYQPQCSCQKFIKLLMLIIAKHDYRLVFLDHPYNVRTVAGVAPAVPYDPAKTIACL